VVHKDCKAWLEKDVFRVVFDFGGHVTKLKVGCVTTSPFPLVNYLNYMVFWYSLLLKMNFNLNNVGLNVFSRKSPTANLS